MLRIYRRQAAMPCLLAISLLSFASILISGQAQEQEPLKDKQSKKAVETLPEEFYQDLRDSWRPAPPWRLVGPDADKMAKPEAAGLRITLSEKRRQTDAVGLQLDARIKGNVEITAGYEILHSGEAKGHGVGFELFVCTDTPTNECLGLLRAARVNEGEVYLSSRITTQNGKRQYYHGHTPTNSKSGKLRLTRVGKEATLSAADGDAGAFQELRRYDLGTEDLTMVRLSAYTGHAANSVDVLIKDLRIHTLNATEAKSQESPRDAPDAPRPVARKGWMAAAGVIILLIALATLGAWLFCARAPAPTRVRSRPKT